MTGQLFLNSNEHFQIDSKELFSGDTLRVLVVDSKNSPRWVNTTVEHNGYSYFLTGLLGYSPVGLFAET